jgi:hypothetical protein
MNARLSRKKQLNRCTFYVISSEKNRDSKLQDHPLSFSWGFPRVPVDQSIRLLEKEKKKMGQSAQ